MGGARVSMVAALARLCEAAARIARLLGIRAMRNAHERTKAGSITIARLKYVANARGRLQCAERRVSQPQSSGQPRSRLYRRDTPHVARYNCTKRRIMMRRPRIFNQTRHSMLRRSSAALSSLRPQATYGRVHGAALHASERIEWIKILKLRAVEFNRNTEICSRPEQNLTQDLVIVGI